MCRNSIITLMLLLILDDGKNAGNSTTINTGTTTETTISITKSSMTRTAIPTTKNNTIPAQFSTDSDDSFLAAIVTSVVVPVIIVVLVVAVLMYRRGQCKLLPGKCRKRYAKRSPDRADTHAMSSTVNVNVYCDLNRDFDVNGRDVDYCDLDKVEQI